jgi:GxxExxY protein
LEVIDTDIERMGKVVLDAAFYVHTQLGPGLLESIYEACFERELRHRKIAYARQKAVPVRYRNALVGANLRLDFVVEDCVVLELKAVESILPIHRAQLVTYLRLSGLRLGYLINFNTIHLRHGVKRIVV